ncbi:Phospholipase B-like 1 isoform A [Micractinium conductrix]|uniref:Phospholipase B-like n=1 Tax=Micractinium conductrix TaxID=554055 RepID=A0A2P6VKN2_9CHLO|nr:Phospholipase B-like 1 isoform A [Micractinium conductrix]|eukprot:PSC74620.1 Phospholipase B-like 1 isoform A [Micractinium conductrix]
MGRTWALLALALLLQAAAALRPTPTGSLCDAVGAGSVARDAEGRWSFTPGGGADDGVAWGSYVDSSATPSNFGQLRVSTTAGGGGGGGSTRVHRNADQLFAAGFLEGYLTAPRIWDSWVNMRDYFNEGMGAETERPMRWIQEQHAWVRARCHEGEPTSAALAEAEEARGGEGGKGDARYWQAVCLLLHQFDGLKAGYRAAGARGDDADAVGEMSDWDFLFLESNGDLYDIIDAQQPDQRPHWLQGGTRARIPTVAGKAGGRHWEALAAAAAEDPEKAAAKLFSQVALSGKCSALIKVADDLSDIFMAHATWDTYTAQLRIYKHYSFNLTQLQPAAQRISFSSYPGELFSDDDFIITSSGLVVLQTTNKIFNDELFEALTPRSVLSWQRVRAATWLAAGGEEWAAHLDTHNSGTYNNQYMIVDLSKFSPREALQPGLLWVAEQIPGKVVAADVTNILAFGYWPSFNVPYFPEIYNASGYPDFVRRLDQHGQHFGRTTHWLSYQTSPRAAIFRRDQASVTDLEGIKALMRSNKWKTDPLSEGHPICAVCGRGDLDPRNPEPRGCFDAKVTNVALALQLQAEAVNGPTTDRWPWSVPPFTWKEPVVANLTHRGQPDRFTFTWERMDPAAPPSLARCAPRSSAGAGAGGGSGSGGSAWARLRLDTRHAEAATLSSSLLLS